ncbi:MAG: DUF1273 domain-containing protein [Firmicutes bacterium]|nr:DUF1273 domain-containing protein [[Eubacterium] siraeum]MCM1488994.1 DUF1273 domain-containing protein [Bacillota bacterium]
MKSCFFTGHRSFEINAEISAKLNAMLIELINAGVTDFYAGGAPGWDMLCEKNVLELKKIYPAIKLHLILPCPPYEQTLKWNMRQKCEYKAILEHADDTEIVSDRYYDGCMKARNMRLAESGEVCLCYLRKKRSGTAQTVSMAEKRGLKIINLADDK